MSEAIENIDLSVYEVEDLNALVEKAKKEIANKEKMRIMEARNQIQQLASDLNMTVEELLNLDAKKKKSSKTVSKIKYRNPADPNQTWTGRGKQPNWLKEAIEMGARKEDFAIA